MLVLHCSLSCQVHQRAVAREVELAAAISAAGDVFQQGSRRSLGLHPADIEGHSVQRGPVNVRQIPVRQKAVEKRALLDDFLPPGFYPDHLNASLVPTDVVGIRGKQDCVPAQQNLRTATASAPALKTREGASRSATPLADPPSSGARLPSSGGRRRHFRLRRRGHWRRGSRGEFRGPQERGRARRARRRRSPWRERADSSPGHHRRPRCAPQRRSRNSKRSFPYPAMPVRDAFLAGVVGIVGAVGKEEQPCSDSAIG